MRRFLLGAALAIVLVTAVGCRGRGVTSRDARENAYRANNLGVALLEQFKYDEAAAAFRRGLAIDPSLAIARVNLGLALLYAQDLAGAAREASEAARLLPSTPQPPYMLGLIARAENRDADALRLFLSVQQIDPHDTGTNTNLGQIYLQQRQYTEAVAVLRLAVADEPYNLTAVYNLGLALTRSGRTDEGQRMLERSQALRATGYAVTFGTTYLEQGRYAEAILSTGLEPELVDDSMPDATFTPVTIGSAPRAATGPASPFGRRFSARELTPAGAGALPVSRQARRSARATGGGGKGGGADSADSADATKIVTNETTTTNSDGTLTVTTTYSDGSTAAVIEPNPSPTVSQSPLAPNGAQLATLLNAQEQASQTSPTANC